MGGNFSNIDDDYSLKQSSSGLPLKPLKFHDVCSSGIIVSPNKLVMRRLDQGWGMTFSNRPIDVDEVICLKIVMFHKGFFRFGLTAKNPAHLDPQDLGTFLYTSAEKTIIKELSAGSTHKDTMIFLKLNTAGQVVYGWQRNDKSKDKGVLFGGITLHLPVWAVFEVSGKNLAIKLEVENIPVIRTKSFRKSTRLKKARSMEFNMENFNIEEAIINEIRNDFVPLTSPFNKMGKSKSCSKMPRAKSFSISSPVYVPLEVSSSTTPNPNHNVENASNLFNIPLSNIEFLPTDLPTTASNPDKVKNVKKKLSKQLSNNEECRTSMCFHCKVGKNINLTSDQMTATRATDNCNGYVFTRRPMELNEKITIKLIQVNPELGGSLGFGLTVCDPSEVSDFPDGADHLLDRQEYWVVIKNLYKNPTQNDELGFLITRMGEVVMFKNDSHVKTILHVDPTLSLWVFFDLCGSIEKISSLGSIMYKNMPKDLIANNKGSSSRKQTSSRRIRNQLTDKHDTVMQIAPTPPSPIIIDNISNDYDLLDSVGPPTLNMAELPTTPSTTTSSGTSSTTTTSTTNHTSKRSKSLIPEMASTHLQQINDSPLIGRLDLYNDIPGSLAPPLIPVPRNPQRNTPKSVNPSKRLTSSFDASRPEIPTKPKIQSAESKSSSTQNVSLKTEDVEKLLNEISMMGNQGQKLNNTKENAQSSESECAVCFENVPDCVLYTCGHVCLCFNCGQNILKSQKPYCPICRKNITDVIKIYKS